MQLLCHDAMSAAWHADASYARLSRECWIELNHRSVADEGKGSSLSEADRAAVRDNLLQGIVRAPPAVRSQLGECAKYVVHTDYPQHWPSLLPSIVAHLGTQVSARQPSSIDPHTP